MKLVYVGFCFEHHLNTHAGYNQIKNYVNYDIVIDCQKEHDFYTKKNKNFFEKVLYKLHLLIGAGCTFAILKCIFLSLTNSDLVFHFVYPENTYKWLFYFKRSNKIVATLHQPVDFFKKDSIWCKRLKHFDDIIVLISDVQNYELLSGKNNVTYLPHGIDTQFYTINNSVVRKKYILMVGNWLRNFEFASVVFDRLLSANDDAEIIIVGSKSNFHHFSRNRRIHLKSNISDDELKNLYQGAAFIFFPLIAYTANNAILEAASCGATIFVSTTEIDYTYFTGSDINFLPVDLEVVVDKLNTYLQQYVTEPDYALSSKVANNYSWQSISLRTTQILLNESTKN